MKEAVRWLKTFNLAPIEAMHARNGYPFYRGLWVGGEPMCPATLPHVQMAFEVNGFKNTQESIFMVAEMPQPPEPLAAAISLDIEEADAVMRHEPMRESWIGFEPKRWVARSGGEEVGSIAWVMQPHLDRLSAPCMNIWGLGMREAFRRRGVAVELISRAMASAWAMGARFASVGTQLWNAPAHATYAKLGYRPHTVVIGRHLEEDQT